MTCAKWQSKRLRLHTQTFKLVFKISNSRIHNLEYFQNEQCVTVVGNGAHSLHYEQLRNSAGQESGDKGALRGAERLNFSRITEAGKQLCIMHTLRTVRLNTLAQAWQLLFAL